MSANSARLADLQLVATLTREMLSEAQRDNSDWPSIVSMARRRQAVLENVFAGLDTLSQPEASHLENVLKAVKASDVQLWELGSTHKQELLESLRGMVENRKAIQHYRDASKQ